MPDRCPCKYPGDRHCQCSREYTRELALWMWERLCARMRSVRIDEWIVIAMVAVVIACAAWGRT